MSAYDDVMKEINRRAKKLKKLRTNSDRNMSREDVVMRFFDDIERAFRRSEDKHDFRTALDNACNFLESRLKAFDPDIRISLSSDNSSADDWKDIRINGVSVFWSEKYLKNHPLEEKEMFIDVSDMLFM